jgi:hypothetical protein
MIVLEVLEGSVAYLCSNWNAILEVLFFNYHIYQTS